MWSANNFPERITIELTNVCNINCSFCPRQNVTMNLGYMDEGLYYKIIDEAAQHVPVSIVLFFRGESLLHQKLGRFIAYAKQKGIGPIQLASNALALTDEIGNELIEAGLDFISFSIDTDDAELYGQSRQNGNLEVSKNNILHFIDKCNAAKVAGKKVPEVQVSSVDIAEYKAGQSAFINFWREHADKVRIYIEHSGDGHLGSINNGELHREMNRQACRKVFRDMVIYWNGDIALCNHDWDNQLSIGNAHTSSLANIWSNAQYEAIRDMHRNGTFTTDIVCKKCDHWQMYYLPEGYLGNLYCKE